MLCACHEWSSQGSSLLQQARLWIVIVPSVQGMLDACNAWNSVCMHALYACKLTACMVACNDPWSTLLASNLSIIGDKFLLVGAAANDALKLMQQVAVKSLESYCSLMTTHYNALWHKHYCQIYIHVWVTQIHRHTVSRGTYAALPQPKCTIVLIAIST